MVPPHAPHRDPSRLGAAIMRRKPALHNMRPRCAGARHDCSSATTFLRRAYPWLEARTGPLANRVQGSELLYRSPPYREAYPHLRKEPCTATGSTTTEADHVELLATAQGIRIQRIGSMPQLRRRSPLVPVQPLVVARPVRPFLANVGWRGSSAFRPDCPRPSTTQSCRFAYRCMRPARPCLVRMHRGPGWGCGGPGTSFRL